MFPAILPGFRGADTGKRALRPWFGPGFEDTLHGGSGPENNQHPGARVMDGSPHQPVLPRAPADLPTPIRGPLRDLRRRPAARPSRRAVRLQALGAEVDGQPLPGRLSPWRHSPLFLPDGRGRPSRVTPAKASHAPEDARSRRLPGAEPRARPRAPLARRGRLPLPAAAGPARLRSPRRRGRVSRLGDGPRPQCPAVAPGLKLLDKERRSHIDDFNCDEALGLFAGLNVLPKKSFADRLLLPSRAATSNWACCRGGSRPWPR